jgi:hypothetical protein
VVDTNRWQDVLEKKCGATTFHIHADGMFYDQRNSMLSLLALTTLQGDIYRRWKAESPLYSRSPSPCLLWSSRRRLSRAMVSSIRKRPILPFLRAKRDSDIFFASILDRLPSQNYTVLYTTTPPAKAHDQPISEASKYEMEMPLEEVLHLDLKRDVDFRPRQPSSNQTIVDGPLFEKYQFLSPGKLPFRHFLILADWVFAGIFMGFFVGILLLSILYVAISGVAGMQVSYAAFEKESGQSAQKRSQ